MENYELDENGYKKSKLSLDDLDKYSIKNISASERMSYFNSHKDKDVTHNISKKAADTLGKDGCKNRSIKGIETMGKEGLKERSKKAMETMGKEGRSNRAKKRIESLSEKELLLIIQRGYKTKLKNIKENRLEVLKYLNEEFTEDDLLNVIKINNFKKSMRQLINDETLVIKIKNGNRYYRAIYKKIQ